jgi:hypothetical protein
VIRILADENLHAGTCVGLATPRLDETIAFTKENSLWGTRQCLEHRCFVW